MLQTSQKVLSKPVSMNAVLSYRNERVMRRYMKDNHVSEEVDEMVFVEMLKFLYLCGVISTPCSPPSKEIDEMWHCFILHTIDYHKFCWENFGRFLHHDPTKTPYIGNRKEMVEVAESAFGALDPHLWRHVVGEALEACSSNCSGDNYCSESCNGGGCTNKVFDETALLIQ